MRRFAIAFCICLASASLTPAAEIVSPYVFTDGQAEVAVDVDAPVACEVRTITAEGRGPARESELAPEDGRLRIRPLAEGIHIVKLGEPIGEQLRFLALDPPAEIVEANLRPALPRHGEKLLAGEPYRVIVMGDSVTATGDFEGLLKMLLARATGNERIRMIERAYPGRSVDAAVRFYRDDVAGQHPDLVMVMYGLNDQAGGVSLAAFLEQYARLAERAMREDRADFVFLQPTPHIAIPVDDASREPDSNPPWYAFRTIRFAESLRPLAAKFDAPLAETFHALWGDGGPSIEQAARNLWPIYPPSHRKQLHSILETGGVGDTIHPNALGHLRIARAVYRAIARPPEPRPLRFTGITTWTDHGPVSHVTVTNVSGERRQGRLAVYPLPHGEIASDGPVEYDLKPGQMMNLTARWARVTEPADLLDWPAIEHLAHGRPRLPVVDYHAGGCGVYAPVLPVRPDAAIVRRRFNEVADDFVDVTLRQGEQHTTMRIELPGDEVGRIPIVNRVTQNSRIGWAAAEVAYVRYGGAMPGEAEIDGRLDEWAQHPWFVVGEPAQARWTQGVADHRPSPDDCYLHWAVKVGDEAMHFAARATGDLARDSFTLFFDPREPAKLGTAGRYYWVAGKLKPEGKVSLATGETSPRMRLTGAWSASEEGDGARIEFSVPYAVFEATDWPDSGDLGLSIWWRHRGPDGRVTNLQWSEDGHPWNPRWYGVLRKVQSPDQPLPYMVRIR